MTEEHIDALEIAFDAYQSLTEEQQGKITGADRFEALFAWVNGQVAMLADDEQGWTVSADGGTVTLDGYNGGKQLSLSQDTVLVLNGESKMERGEYPILLNGHTLTVRGDGSLEVVMQSKDIGEWYRGAISNGTTSDDYRNGTLILESGTLTVRSHCSGIAVGNVTVTGGRLCAYSEMGNGIAVINLSVQGNTAYVYGSCSGYAGCTGIGVLGSNNVSISDELSILCSDQQEAQEENMQVGGKEVFGNENARTVLICKADKPMLSVGPQTGELYPQTAGSATFAISGLNYTKVEASWGDSAPTGLTATIENSTLTVTADNTVQQGTYLLTLTASGTNGTAAKTVPVTVSGIPLTIEKQPEDNVTGQVEQNDFFSAFVEVTPSRTDNVTYQWKVKGENEQTVASDLTGQTGAKLYLADIPENMRQDTAESWKKTARVYCTVTYNGSYSVDSETVTVIFSTCNHMGQYSPKGKCQRCGYQLDVNDYDWISEGNKYKGKVTSAVSEGGTVYLLHDWDTVKGYTFQENVTVDLQGHTVGSFSVQQFQNTTITNGTITSLNFPDDNGMNLGTVNLSNLTVTNTVIGPGTTVTVGENCVFKERAQIEGETKLTGGTFENGIAYSAGNVQHLLDILADGYAYFEKDDQGNDQICEYFRADSENVSVKPHKCKFSFGECVCGRVCTHNDTDENGVCKNCGMMAQPFAIGETRYATLKDAVDAAADGDTVTMGSDVRLGQESLTDNQLTISKSIILDLGGHILAEYCGETKQEAPISVAGTVTIRNGTIENRYTAKPTDAVGVIKNGRLTVEGANLNGSETVGIEGHAVTIVEGSMTLVSGTVRGIFVDTDGSLTVTGGTASWLGAGKDAGSIQLSGGVVARFNGKTGCDDATAVKEMLAPYYAYADHMGELITLEAARNFLPNWSVTIVKCTHPAGISETQTCQYCGKPCNHPAYENGACTICGTVCKHPGVTENGGVYTCSTCGLQMAVKVEQGQTVSYYPQEINSEGADSTLYDIIQSLQNNSTVTLLMDGIRLFANINNGNTVTLDLNGKNALESSNGIVLFNNSTLKLIGTGSIATNGSSSISFRMLSGTLDLSGWTGGNIGTVYVWSGTLKPPAQGGIAKLELNEEGTRLSGGWYGNIIRCSGASSEPAGSFLDGGCAFRKADGSFVNYDQKITQYEGIENVTVVPCPHEKLPDSLSGRNCPYCNTILAALVETSTGTKGYAAAQYAVNDANQGDTVVLLIDLKDNAGTLTVSKPCTLDLNGHTVEKLTVTGDVTLESLLPQGYAYKTGSRWVSEPSGKTLTDVTMALVPFKDLRAENDNVTITYGQTATLKALVTGYGKTPTMQWSQKTNGTYAPISGANGDTLTLSKLNAGNYVYRFTYTVDGYSKSVDFTVTIDKAPLEIAAVRKDVTYGDPIPEYYTVTYTGFQNGETPEVLKGKPTFTCAYTPTSKADASYTITPSGLTADNYKITFVDSIVSVSPRVITIEWSDTSFTYNGTPQAPTATAGSTINGDKLTLTVTGTGKNAGNYTAEAVGITGPNAENYCLPEKNTVGFAIGQKPVSVEVTVGDKDFDGTRDAAVESAALTGVLAGDAVAVQAGKVSFAHAAPGTWEVTLEKLPLTGADAGNYSLTNPQPTGITATIRASDRYLDLSQTFPEETEVTVNGKKQTVSTDGGNYLNLPEEAELLTTYETNGDYPTGMRVYRIIRNENGSRLEAVPELENLLQYAGCSIRLTGTKGIRMITALDGATKAALTGAGLAGFTLEEYGTVVAKKSSLGDNDLTLETGKHNFAYKKGVSDPVFGNASNLTQYTNVLVGFSLEDCKEMLVMRPYILLRDETGEVHTVYGGVVTRSIGYIAKQNENTYRPGTDGYSYIHEIIAAVYGQG